MQLKCCFIQFVSVSSQIEITSLELNLQPDKLHLSVNNIIYSSKVTWITRGELKWLIHCLQMTHHDAFKNEIYWMAHGREKNGGVGGAFTMHTKKSLPWPCTEEPLMKIGPKCRTVQSQIPSAAQNRTNSDPLFTSSIFCHFYFI